MDKLRIVICDENKIEAEGYAKICSGICESKSILADLKIYLSNHDLMFDMEDKAFSALVSMLIIEPAGSFEKIAETVRKEGYDGIILYLSHSISMEYYHQAFDVGAYNFIQKGTDKKSLARFQSIFEQTLEAAKRPARHHIVVSAGGEYKQIEIKDIYYFEAAMDHMINVEFRNGSFKFISTLKSLEERLRNRGFSRSHRSYLISIGAVHKLEYDQVTLTNGKKLPVSRSYYASLKTALEKWNI